MTLRTLSPPNAVPTVIGTRQPRTGDDAGALDDEAGGDDVTAPVDSARTAAILGALDADGQVSVRDLARRLGVSDVTIRKDLEALQARAALRRVRGGAVPVERDADPAAQDEGPFEARMRLRRAEKEAVADAVAPLVADGDVIALDSSTTCHLLATRLLDRHGLVVVTNSLRTATLLAERTDATVLVPGGTVRRPSFSLVGDVGASLAGRGRIDRGFFSGTGISPGAGLAEFTAEEAHAKQVLAAPCREVHALVDPSKFGGLSLCTSIPADRLTAVWTTAGADPGAVAALRAAGVTVNVPGAPSRPGREEP